jgi:glycosyltransferase 2 family protein
VRRLSRPSRRWWLGLLFSGGSVLALAVLLAREDWPALLEPLQRARTELLALAMLLAILVELVKAARWLVLLGLPWRWLRPLFGLLLVSRLLNVVAPLRAGDAWRLAVVARATQRRLLTVGGSVLAEKALDGTGLLLASLLAFGPSAIGGQVESSTALVLAGLALLVLVGLLGRRWRRAAWATRALVELSHLRRGRPLVLAASLTGLELALALLVNLLVLAAFGREPSAQATVLMILAGTAAGLAPAAPGQLGLFELAVSAALVGLGQPSNAAIAVALALHLVVLGNVAAGALLALPLRGWQPGALTGRVETA